MKCRVLSDILLNKFDENKTYIMEPAFSTKDREEIEKRLKSYLARQIWGTEGYYEVNNNYDLTVGKALETK